VVSRLAHQEDIQLTMLAMCVLGVDAEVERQLMNLNFAMSMLGST
jgi:hypothetical protein